MRIYLTDDNGIISKGSQAIISWFRIGGCKECTITVSDGTSESGEDPDKPEEIMVWYLDLCEDHSDVIVQFMSE